MFIWFTSGTGKKKNTEDSNNVGLGIYMSVCALKALSDSLSDSNVQP